MRTESREVSGPAVKVSAMKMWFDYHANEVQADNLYRGRRLDVSGMVMDIKKDFTDDVYLTLMSGNEFEPVHAYLAESESGSAAHLQMMQGVELDCVGGQMLIGSPVLKDCKLIDRPIEEPRRSVAPTEPESVPEVPAQSEPEEQPANGGAPASPDAKKDDGDEGTHQQAPAPIVRQ